MHADRKERLHKYLEVIKSEDNVENNANKPEPRSEFDVTCTNKIETGARMREKLEAGTKGDQ